MRLTTLGAPDTLPAITSSARKLLAHEIGDARTPEDVAAAATRACRKIADHFARLVGKAGVRALFERSVTLTAKSVPWLADAMRAPASSADERSEDEWASLRAALEAQKPKQAIETMVVLLATLLQLIARFIGNELVLSLLGELWPGVFPKDEKGTQ